MSSKYVFYLATIYLQVTQYNVIEPATDMNIVKGKMFFWYWTDDVICYILIVITIGAEIHKN